MGDDNVGYGDINKRALFWPRGIEEITGVAVFAGYVWMFVLTGGLGRWVLQS